MRDFNENTATAAVLERMSGAKDPRFKEIMTSVVTHLHAVVREVEPTMDEWMAAIQFLTATGQNCDDKRQEFILLSDTLGVSMLVDAINNRKPSGATESTVLGPFHVAGAPQKKMGDTISLDGKGEPAYVSGRVLDQAGKPIAGALLDVWQTSSDGAYDIQDPEPAGDEPPRPVHHRRRRPLLLPHGQAVVLSDPDRRAGRQDAAGLGRHPMRPAHIHFIVGAPGFEPVTTHIFVDGDEYLDSDAVFGVKDSLIEPISSRHDDPGRGERARSRQSVLHGRARFHSGPTRRRVRAMNLFDLTGKVALVTGARTGLGRAMAEALADAGADIVGLGSRPMPDTASSIVGRGRRFVEIVRDLDELAGFSRARRRHSRRYRPHRYSRQQCRHHPPRRAPRLHARKTGTR